MADARTVPDAAAVAAAASSDPPAITAIERHRADVLRQAQRMSLLWLGATFIAVLGLTVLRGNGLTGIGAGDGPPRLPLWVSIVAAVGAVTAFRFVVQLVRAASQDSWALEHQPLRAWMRHVVLEHRLPRRDPDRWLLLYATGDGAPVAPFAAIAADPETETPVSPLVVDVFGFPKRGHLLTIADARTQRVLAMGAVASTPKTVALMRQL